MGGEVRRLRTSSWVYNASWYWASMPTWPAYTYTSNTQTTKASKRAHSRKTKGTNRNREDNTKCAESKSRPKAPTRRKLARGTESLKATAMCSCILLDCSSWNRWLSDGILCRTGLRFSCFQFPVNCTVLVMDLPKPALLQQSACEGFMPTVNTNQHWAWERTKPFRQLQPTVVERTTRGSEAEISSTPEAVDCDLFECRTVLYAWHVCIALLWMAFYALLSLQRGVGRNSATSQLTSRDNLGSRTSTSPEFPYTSPSLNPPRPWTSRNRCRAYSWWAPFLNLQSNWPKLRGHQPTLLTGGSQWLHEEQQSITEAMPAAGIITSRRSVESQREYHQVYYCVMMTIILSIITMSRKHHWMMFFVARRKSRTFIFWLWVHFQLR